MQQDISILLKGRITKVTGDGRFGVVELEPSYGSIRYAVIGEETRGRIALMNKSPKGQLVIGTEVVIEKARRGIDSLRVLQLSME